LEGVWGLYPQAFPPQGDEKFLGKFITTAMTIFQDGEHRTMRNLDLNQVCTYLRLAANWQWITSGQYQHAAGMVAEIGRL
jgi:hypothetical protein